MKCYDCAVTGDTATEDTVAIGVCRRCGLVVCADHGRVTQVLVHRPNGVGKATSDRPARRVLCSPCHSAERPH
ncbi:DUF2180 family protein [Streptomyces diacarni]|uniref:DUF2180 family protein n=1 Tax=Streptomyces diacarni TaxID=2800381 RepID=A0A367E9N6_9ACTN|nr:DUF2180 family protein [Streptomyces diacarni]RCG13960.1 DUF2180 family protein [Streptomyces diacarni]